MLARSQKEFERHQREAEEDRSVRSAIDQLEALQLMSPSTRVDPFVVRFGEGAENDHITFDFQLPRAFKKWPAPHYGRYPLHEKLLTNNRSLRIQRFRPARCHQQHEDLCRNLPRKFKRPDHIETIVVRPSVPLYQSPFRFLDLPPEIRNAIYHLIAVKDEPIEPALRRICPCKRQRARGKDYIRRSPPEPALALASQQLRRECLSIFYAANHFVLVKNASPMFRALSMTSPDVIAKWRPRREFAAHLAHVEVHFSALPRLSSAPMWVAYVLRRRADGDVTATLKALEQSRPAHRLDDKLAPPPEAGAKAESDQLCVCTEADVLPKLLAAVAATRGATDLVDVAVCLIEKRLESLFGAARGIQTRTYQPGWEKCPRCQKPSFEAVHVGL